MTSRQGTSTWPVWAGRRFYEIGVFIVASLGLTVVFDSHADLVATFILVGIQLLIYCGAFLYLVLSGLLWLFMARKRVVRLWMDSVFFVIHSYGAMSYLHGGLLVFDKPVGLDGAGVAPWLAVLALHVVFALTSKRHSI